MDWKQIFTELLANPTTKSVEVTSWQIHESEEVYAANPIFKVEKFTQPTTTTTCSCSCQRRRLDLGPR